MENSPYSSTSVNKIKQMVSLYHFVPFCTSLYQFVPVCTILYQFVPVCTSLYKFVQVCTRLYTFVQVCTSFVPVYTSKNTTISQYNNSSNVIKVVLAMLKYEQIEDIHWNLHCSSSWLVLAITQIFLSSCFGWN